ncbi:uncharacterized protein SCODWIG_03706 [Saccharomycodes ludwigii]|uniref:Uncharacterized protein n=1 Tax=Saccharomycodes ludwigii TaxID=36035 RepID=A0A376BB88_9ASCO|nr:hypothetical protein SCDLUD_001716 [Saccharomycodes ludwigii]KAH3901931.1 hypothetical protein SCDLUD_001716 [Saccharomycodes ludwigii]SSD61945.1 uncharacterized protein SCODWIG_03706 [Saccharomycodes ludwigii]
MAKRSNIKRSSPAPSPASTPVPVAIPDYYTLVAPEISAQLIKYITNNNSDDPNFLWLGEVLSKEETQVNSALIKSLIITFEYQYVVSWLYYTTANSFFIKNRKSKPFLTLNWSVTSNGNNNTDNNGTRFCELLLLHEISVSNQDNNTNTDGNNIKTTIFDSIVLEILKVYCNDKQTKLDEIDEILSLKEGTWDATLNLVTKFQVLYKMIKHIERKNMVFKNHLNNNLDLWYFPTYEVETDVNGVTKRDGKDKSMGNNIRKKYMILPGGKIIELVINYTQDLTMPLNLKNCITVDDNGVDIAVNYSRNLYDKIDKYQNGIDVKHNVLAYDFDSFMKFNTEVVQLYTIGSDQEELNQLGEFYVNELKFFHSKLRQQKKDFLSSSILHGTRRSSRLIRLEEEQNKNRIIGIWDLKLAQREKYMKARNRALNKFLKTNFKDILLEDLRKSFASDYESAARLTISTAATDSNLNDREIGEFDDAVIKTGENFSKPIFPVIADDTNADEIKNDLSKKCLELPSKYLISKEHIKHLHDNNILLGCYDEYLRNEDNDTTWFYNCISAPNELKVFSGRSDGLQKIDVYGEIICCDKCHRWMSWKGVLEKMFNKREGGENIDTTIIDLYLDAYNLDSLDRLQKQMYKDKIVDMGPSPEETQEKQRADDPTITETNITDADKDIILNANYNSNLLHDLDPSLIIPSSSRRGKRGLEEDSSHNTKKGKYNEDSDNEENRNNGITAKDDDAEIDAEFPIYQTGNRPLEKLKNTNGFRNSLFICLFCLDDIEAQCRDIFINTELVTLRGRERKKQEDQVKRLKAKLKRDLEKKRNDYENMPGQEHE